MWGYEGEELSDIEATVEHVKKTDPDIFFTTVAYPIKGTPYFSEVADRVEGFEDFGAKAPTGNFGFATGTRASFTSSPTSYCAAKWN